MEPFARGVFLQEEALPRETAEQHEKEKDGVQAQHEGEKPDHDRGQIF
jgi:hypothetical protein